MMLTFVKFFHVICGVSFLGIIIASFYYITRSINKQDRTLIDYSLKASYFGDAVILVFLFIQLASAITLVSAGHFTLAVPWIFMAYFAFGLLSTLWLLTLFIKKVYLSKAVIAPYFLKSFYILNTAMILIFIMIIHDAVTKSTALEFLVRN